MKINSEINYNKISSLQLFFLIFLTQSGVGILSLPRDLSAIAQQDAWIAVLLAMLVNMAMVYIVVTLSLRFQGLTLVEISHKLLGKFFGTILSLGYVLYFFVVTVYETRTSVNLVVNWILSYTNEDQLLLLSFIPFAYIVRKGLKVIALCFNFYFYHLLPAILILLWPLANFEARFVLPIGAEGVIPILKAIFPAMASFYGYELILLVGHKVENPRGIMPIALLSTALVGLIYTAVVFLVIGFFGINEIKFQVYPLLYMARTLRVAFLERLDIIIHLIWLIVTFTTAVMYYYLTVYGFSRILKLKDHKNLTLYFLPLVFFANKLLEGAGETILMGFYLNYVGIITVGLIPFLLLVLALVTGKKGGIKSEKV